MTNPLIEFLLARIAEDEAARNEARDSTGVSREESDGWTWVRHSKAECKAKREIVELHAENARSAGLFSTEEEELSLDTLRWLALPYADHADYRQKWKVGSDD